MITDRLGSDGVDLAASRCASVALALMAANPPAPIAYLLVLVVVLVGAGSIGSLNRLIACSYGAPRR